MQVRKMGESEFRDTLICRLKEIREKDLYRRIQPVEGPQKESITIRGQKVLSLSSNNYLGLANHPSLKKAAIQAIKELGCGAGASRLISGSMLAHEKLETLLAQFKKTESALVFPTGYHANLGTLSALMGQDDIIFSDALNHASIIDGCRLSGANIKVFRHRDMDHLRNLLKECTAYRHRLIVVDTVFSMDGDIAPLSDIVGLAKTYNAWVMVDEAHATGVFGPTGAGVVEKLGLSRDIDIQMGTLGKALGCMGAYVAGNRDLIELLTNRSRGFIYTTALLPSAAATALAALKLIQQEPIRRIRLMDNVSLLREDLSQLGFNLGPSSSQIIPVLIGSESTTLSLQEELFNRGIWGQAVRPPTIPMGTSRIRLTPMATHTKSQLRQVVAAFSEAGRALGIL